MAQRQNFHRGKNVLSVGCFAACVSTPFCEEWYGNTGSPHHSTDSLRCMRDLMSVSLSVGGIGGGTCDVSLQLNLTVVLVAELKDVLLFSPVRSLTARRGIDWGVQMA